VAMKQLLLGAVALLLMYSTISMAKPAFYLLSLNTKGQLDLELGPPYAENVFDEENPDGTEYLYRGGHIKPFCIDYVMRYSCRGDLTNWTWHFCRGKSPIPTSSPDTSEDPPKRYTPFKN
jgi:hypothetical protein